MPAMFPVEPTRFLRGLGHGAPRSPELIRDAKILHWTGPLKPWLGGWAVLGLVTLGIPVLPQILGGWSVTSRRNTTSVESTFLEGNEVGGFISFWGKDHDVPKQVACLSYRWTHRPAFLHLRLSLGAKHPSVGKASSFWVTQLGKRL